MMEVIEVTIIEEIEVTMMEVKQKLKNSLKI